MTSDSIAFNDAQARTFSSSDSAQSNFRSACTQGIVIRRLALIRFDFFSFLASRRFLLDDLRFRQLDFPFVARPPAAAHVPRRWHQAETAKSRVSYIFGTPPEQWIQRTPNFDWLADLTTCPRLPQNGQGLIVVAKTTAPLDSVELSTS